MKPNENSIGTIHNWKNDNKWRWYIIRNSRAKEITESKWFEYLDMKYEVNAPLYVE